MYRILVKSTWKEIVSLIYKWCKKIFIKAWIWIKKTYSQLRIISNLFYKYFKETFVKIKVWIKDIYVKLRQYTISEIISLIYKFFKKKYFQLKRNIIILYKFCKELCKRIWAWIKKKYSQLKKFIKKSLIIFYKFVKKICKSIWVWIKKQYPLFKKFIKEACQKIWVWIKKQYSRLEEFIKRSFISFCKFVKETCTRIWVWIKKEYFWLEEFIKRSFKAFYKYFEESCKGRRIWIKKQYSRLEGFIKRSFKAFYKYFEESCKRRRVWVNKKYVQIKDFIYVLPKNLFELVRLIKGFFWTLKFYYITSQNIYLNRMKKQVNFISINIGVNLVGKILLVFILIPLVTLLKLNLFYILIFLGWLYWNIYWLSNFYINQTLFSISLIIWGGTLIISSLVYNSVVVEEPRKNLSVILCIILLSWFLFYPNKFKKIKLIIFIYIWRYIKLIFSSKLIRVLNLFFLLNIFIYSSHYLVNKKTDNIVGYWLVASFDKHIVTFFEGLVCWSVFLYNLFKTSYDYLDWWVVPIMYLPSVLKVVLSKIYVALNYSDLLLNYWLEYSAQLHVWEIAIWRKVTQRLIVDYVLVWVNVYKIAINFIYIYKAYTLGFVILGIIFFIYKIYNYNLKRLLLIKIINFFCNIIIFLICLLKISFVIKTVIFYFFTKCLESTFGKFQTDGYIHMPVIDQYHGPKSSTIITELMAIMHSWAWVFIHLFSTGMLALIIIIMYYNAFHWRRVNVINILSSISYLIILFSIPLKCSISLFLSKHKNNLLFSSNKKIFKIKKYLSYFYILIRNIIIQLILFMKKKTKISIY